MFTRPRANQARRRRSAADFRARLLLEVLEGRIAPATFTVTNTSDSGAGSLRQAIVDANTTTPSADTIVFGPLFNTAQTITLASTLPDVTDALTINGPGASLLTVRRDPANTAFFRIISLVAETTLSGVTLSGGRTIPVTPFAHAGGAILIRGTAPMTILNSVISGNSASGVGGGIFGYGNLTIRNSTISGNTSGVDALFGSGWGGGIYFVGGNLLMENCTVSGNASSRGGGGLYLYGGTATIRNSTISGNTAPHGGGAVSYLTGNVSFQNCTIVGNSAYAVGGGGGGIMIFQWGGAPVVSVTSTVVANNTVVSGTGADIHGAVISNFSLIRNQAGATIAGNNNLAAGTDPMLAPLGFYGGPTQTMALLAGSPLINAGSNAASLTTDQRGPAFGRVDGAAADVGAFEIQAAGQASLLSVNVNPYDRNAAQRSVVNHMTVTFNRVVSFVGPPANAFQLDRVGPGTPNGKVNLTVFLVSNAAQTIALLTFSSGALTEGHPRDFLSLIDGNYSFTVISSRIAGGLAGGDNVSTLYRLFGDVNGDMAVNGLDLAAFRDTFGKVATDAGFLAPFDLNGDGAVNGLDLAQFRLRFGTTLP